MKAPENAAARARRKKLPGSMRFYASAAFSVALGRITAAHFSGSGR